MYIYFFYNIYFLYKTHLDNNYFEILQTMAILKEKKKGFKTICRNLSCRVYLPPPPNSGQDGLNKAFPQKNTFYLMIFSPKNVLINRFGWPFVG